MARTLEQIQQEFDAATLETRNAYDKLKNMRSSKTFIEKNRATYPAILIPDLRKLTSWCFFGSGIF